MKWFFICIILFTSAGLYAGETMYFPEGTFEQRDELKELDREAIKGFSHFLSTMQEPSLWEISNKTKKEIYRFVLARTFQITVCIRVEIQKSGNALVFLKVVPYGIEPHPENLSTDECKNASQNDVSTLKAKISKVNFWKIKPSDYPSLIEGEDGSFTVMADGTSWFFEGIKNGKYQAFSVPNPTAPLFKADEMVELGKIFLSLAKIEVENLR